MTYIPKIEYCTEIKMKLLITTEDNYLESKEIIMNNANVQFEWQDMSFEEMMLNIVNNKPFVLNGAAITFNMPVTVIPLEE